jgi:hypothetical protein
VNRSAELKIKLQLLFYKFPKSFQFWWRVEIEAILKTKHRGHEDPNGVNW